METSTRRNQNRSKVPKCAIKVRQDVTEVRLGKNQQKFAREIAGWFSVKTTVRPKVQRYEGAWCAQES